MFNRRNHEQEYLDTKKISGPELVQNLKEFEWINKSLGSRATLIKALNKIYSQHPDFKQKEIKIADLGCGAGDLLKEIYHWAEKRNLSVQLYGIDHNADIIQYAQENAKGMPIQFHIHNILSPAIYENDYDIICLNNVCHHFEDEILFRFLKNLRQYGKKVIIINDLHRHVISLYAIQWLTKILNMSSFACHDGPLSVKKAFRKHELKNLLLDLNIKHYTIAWCWPFRWLVIIEP